MRRFSLAFAATFALSLAAGCTAVDVEEEGAEAADSNLDLSNDPGALIKLPYYFAMPKSALSGPLAREKYTYSTLWNASSDAAAGDLGLRVIAVPEGGGPGTPARRSALKNMTTQLARAGVLADGDVVLSFRPALADSMPYPHIQMGSTHAGMAFTRTENGAVQGFNLDQPLDGDYNTVEGGTKFAGKFDSLHYAGCTASDNVPAGGFKCKKDAQGQWQKDAGTEGLHILRPRNMTAEKKANLLGWVELLGRRHAALKAAGVLKFNSDYLKPLLANPAYGHSVQKQATMLGKLLTGRAQPPADGSFVMFCSELVFHLQVLSACTQEQIASAGDAAECAGNAALPFVPMKLADPQYAGLADGPMLGLLSIGASPSEKSALYRATFSDGAGAARLSSGHRAVNQALVDSELLGAIQHYYGDRLEVSRLPLAALTAEQQRDPRRVGMRAQAEGAPLPYIEGATQGLRNYSPTAYLVNAALPAAHPLRSIDYVATVIITPEAGIEKAKRLARNPQP